MNTADLITAFFNNEMSPDQERQFLLSVASSDSLRLGLKSHVMLDKILYEESSNSRVPVDVRMNIMKQAAVVAAAAAGSALAPEDALAGTKEQVVSGSRQQNIGGQSGVRSSSRPFFRWSSAALVLMLGIGSFFAGFYTGSADEPAANTAIQENTIQNSSPATASELPGDQVQAPASSASLTTGEANVEKGGSTVSANVEKQKENHAVASVRGTTRNTQPRSTPASGGTAANGGTTQGADQGNSATPSSVMSSGPLQVINDSSHK